MPRGQRSGLAARSCALPDCPTTFAPIQARRLQTALISCALADARTEGRVPTLDGWPLDSLRRALRALRRRGGLGRWADAVLVSMSDLGLLRLVVSERERRPQAVGSRGLDPNQAEEQIARVLPLASKWRHHTWLLALSLSGLTLWIAGQALAHAGGHGLFPQAGILLAVLLCSLFLVVWQYCWPPPKSTEDYDLFASHGTGVVFAFLGIIVICLVVPRLTGVGSPFELRAGPLTDQEWVEGFWTAVAVFIAPFTTSLLAPSAIARWRGANLLFPTAVELRLQRLVLIGAGVAACLALGWLTGFLARLVTPS